jgi:hypothetical protein
MGAARERHATCESALKLSNNTWSQACCTPFHPPVASTAARGYPMDCCTLSVLSHPTLPPINPGGLCGLHASSRLDGVSTPTPIETSGELPDYIIAPVPRPELIAAKIDPLSLWSSTACGNLRPHVSNPCTASQVSTYLPQPRTTPHHGPHHTTPHHTTRPKNIINVISI